MNYSSYNNSKIKIIQSSNPSNTQQSTNPQQSTNSKIKILNQGTIEPRVEQRIEPIVEQRNDDKIKFKKEILVAPDKANYFDILLTKVQQEITSNESHYNIQPYSLQKDQVIYQFWRFEFEGKGNFEKKCISGLLKFQPDHPKSPPRFEFDPIYTKTGTEVLQHENIYGDHSLCIPLFSYWKATTAEFDILQAIEHIFHNPNWSQTDAPANPTFSNFPPQKKQEIQRIQAQYLPEFCKVL